MLCAHCPFSHIICLNFIFYPLHWSFYLIIVLFYLQMLFLFFVYCLFTQSYFLVAVSSQISLRILIRIFKFLLFLNHFYLFQDWLFGFCVSVSLFHAPGSFSREVMCGSLFVSGMKGWGHFSRTPCGLLMAESRSPPQLSLSPARWLTDWQTSFWGDLGIAQRPGSVLH